MQAPPTVHIIDDDEAIRSSLRLLIKTSGLSPSTYSSAEELLEKADLTQHGCLVVDGSVKEDVIIVGQIDVTLQRQIVKRRRAGAAHFD